MAAPVEITSVSQWNTQLRNANAAGRPVIVDFHATWCGPCKQIAPFYDNLASKHYQYADFVRVDVDVMKPIAAKYQISAMPTFLVLKNGESLDTMKGADPRGLKAIVEKHAVPPSLPAQAEQAKAEGNKAFTSGDYLKAIELYGQAITHAPRSAVLHANRAFSYIKLIQGTNTPIEERKTLRPKALQDAILATELDERWGKGWVRLAEAMLLAGDDEAMQDVAESARDVQKQKCLEGAIEALQNAVGLSDGKVKMEAEKKLAELKSRS